MTCTSFLTSMDEWLRHELESQEAAEMAEHAAGCSECSARSADARRFHGALSAAVIELPEAELLSRLEAARNGALAFARAELVRRPTAAGSWLAYAAAAALVLVAGAGLLPGLSGEARTSTAAAVAPTDEVSLTTVVGESGTTLRWDGNSTAYLVIKSRRPSGKDGSAVAVVCGKSWTDSAREPGPVFYQVVPARESCRI